MNLFWVFATALGAVLARRLHITRGKGTITATARVVRGGSYFNNRRNCRSAYRNRNEPINFNNNIGFRVVRSTRWVWPVVLVAQTRQPRLNMAGRIPASSPKASYLPGASGGVANIESPGPLW